MEIQSVYSLFALSHNFIFGRNNLSSLKRHGFDSVTWINQISYYNGNNANESCSSSSWSELNYFKIQAKFETVMVPYSLWFCHAQDFDGSQIPVTTERFELQTSPMECSYIVPQTKSTLRLSGLGNCIACKMLTVQIFL